VVDFIDLGIDGLVNCLFFTLL